MTEKKKYNDLIIAMREKTSNFTRADWEKWAEQVTTDEGFRRKDASGVTSADPSTENFPIVLRHLLPDAEIKPEEATEIAFAFSFDNTIPLEVMRPFGALLVGNLARMRDLISVEN